MSTPIRTDPISDSGEHDRASFSARRLGFRAAFLDSGTMTIHFPRFADGRIAPFHLLDGLPDEVVVHRLPSGRVTHVKAGLISGFERNGFFYTRRAASRACQEWVAPRMRLHKPDSPA